MTLSKIEVCSYTESNFCYVSFMLNVANYPYMLSVIMMNVANNPYMLNVNMLNVVLLIVVVPFKSLHLMLFQKTLFISN
jgi:hypothetical protein